MPEYDPMNDANNGGETILDIDTSDAVEPSVVMDGEYRLRITGFRKDSDGKIVRTAASGSKYFIVTFDIPTEATSKSLSKIFSIPDESMEPKRLNMCKWDLEVFKRAFKLTELNFSTMVGAEGYALLTIKQDAQYGESNEVKKFITGPTEVAEF